MFVTAAIAIPIRFFGKRTTVDADNMIYTGELRVISVRYGSSFATSSSATLIG
jgi:hypothetical protein